MPIARYIIWVGTSLLALLFVANEVLPESLPEPAHEESSKPVIRITSMQRPPERVVIDTSQPTIVPPPLLTTSSDPVSPSPPQLYASVDSSGTVVDSLKKRAKAVKRRETKTVASQTAALNVQADARVGPARSTRLSLANIVSGKLLRDLFNLH